MFWWRQQCFTAPNAWFHTLNRWVDRRIAAPLRQVQVITLCHYLKHCVSWHRSNFGSVGEELLDVSCTHLKWCGSPQPQRWAVMWFWATRGEAAEKGLLLFGKNIPGQKSLWICMSMETIYKRKLTCLLSHLSLTKSILSLDKRSSLSCRTVLQCLSSHLTFESLAWFLQTNCK